jgi:hypothetical protein
MFSASGRVWGMADYIRGRTGPPPARMVRAAADELSSGIEPSTVGVARVDPRTGEASAVPAIGGGARL